jgi:hypothetical protein
MKEGFPEKRDDIRTERDQGDLNEGKFVRTKKGSRSGAVSSFHNGVYGSVWYGDLAYFNLVVAGGVPSELKI